jgi:hypothetical protein
VKFIVEVSMFEKIVQRSGKMVTEVRSDGGKLLYVKTDEGYEMKCPRTKQICLVRYEDMLSDCLRCLEGQPPMSRPTVMRGSKINRSVQRVIDTGGVVC